MHTGLLEISLIIRYRLQPEIAIRDIFDVIFYPDIFIDVSECEIEYMNSLIILSGCREYNAELDLSRCSSVTLCLMPRRLDELKKGKMTCIVMRWRIFNGSQ